MLTLLQSNVPALAAAVLIGIATAFWILRVPGRDKKQENPPQ